MATGTFGERLKRERELREVTLDEITSATRIGPRFLEALENEQWERLPGGVFNRGFVRAIARYLGLDEEAFLAEYDLAYSSQVQPKPEAPEERIPSPPIWLSFAVLIGAIALVVIVFAAGLYGWRYYHARRAHGESIPAVAVVPESAAASPGSAPGSAPVPSLDLSISASGPAHLRVSADGYVVFDNDLRAGDNRHFFAIDKFQVSASDSAAVLLELNGQAMPPLGEPGASGTIVLSQKDLRQAPGGNTQP
jgi:cytoskeleton protein RodZ